MSTLRNVVVTGTLGLVGVAAIAIVVRRRRPRRIDGTCGTDSISAETDAPRNTHCRVHGNAPCSCKSAPQATGLGNAPCPVQSASAPPASMIEPWQGRGVIRALGSQAPEESIMDVMVDFYERVLGDEETKDLEIEMSNGSLHAHSVILCASSEAIKGILRHNGCGAGVKKLVWRDYPLEVGNFLLRLLYTGTVDEANFSKDSDTAAADKVPLSVLLGSFEIAMIYLITHLLPTLVQALQHRLAVDTFNSICTTAIKVDAMALRMYCLQYARSNPRDIRYQELKSGMRVRALRHIDHENADVAAGTTGTVEWGHGDWLDIHWNCQPSYTNGLQEVLGSIDIVDNALPGKTLRQMYNSEECSPEVNSELATIWGQVRPSMKRRSHRIM